MTEYKWWEEGFGDDLSSGWCGNKESHEYHVVALLGGAFVCDGEAKDDPSKEEK